MGYKKAIWPRCHTEWGQSIGQVYLLLPSCHLCSSFPFVGDLGTSVGLGEPTRIWGETQECLGISSHHPHPQKVRNPLYRAMLLQFLWSDEYSPKETCWVLPCCISICSQEPALLKTHFPSNMILCFLSLTVSSRCNDKRVHRMAAAMVMWWVLAISSWISDKWLCGLWQAINFPYFHSFW